MDCFHFLDILNTVGIIVDTNVYFLLCGVFLFPFIIYLEVELWGNMVTLCLIFWGATKLFPKLL